MASAPVVIDLSADSDNDELDILSLPQVALSATPPKKINARKLTLRISLPAPNQSLNTRKRTLSTSAIENHAVNATAKKLKLDDKKAITAAVNVKRDTRDAARKCWLHRHRTLFLPLMPSNAIFDKIQKELDGSSDPTPYVPLHELDQQPKFIEGGIMKDYQLQGLSFLVWMYKNGMNCILGDEMGLGKTLQTLSLFAYIKQHVTGPHDPHLVICPLSVLSSWQMEASRWLPSFRTIRFHGPGSERERLKLSFKLSQFDIMITTYESFVAEDAWFKNQRWTYCVLDEGHKIKNSETNVSHKIQGIGSLYRLILTGTPVQNNLVELWGLLHWLYPSVFTPASERLFKESFDLGRGKYTVPFLAHASNLVSKIMLRRTKATVEADVPPREELTVFIPFTEAQRFWTYRLLTRLDAPDLRRVFSAGAGDEDVKREEQAVEVEAGAGSEGRREVLSHLEEQVKEEKTRSPENGTEWKKLMNLLMQLRKVCDHPYLLPGAEPSPYGIGEHIVAASSKMIAIDKLLADILPKGERVLIFSQWKGMLDLLEDFMALRSIRYARLDGSTTRPRRALDIKLFQQETSPYQVFLISTKAGGLGINLTKASTVIMCDSDWNPQNDLQAIARAHRIGQTKIVKVYRLICRASVEDQMLDRIRRKLFLSLKVMGSDNPSSDSENTSLGSSDLMDILRRGSSALTYSDDGMNLAKFLDASIAEILDVSRSHEHVRDVKLKQEVKAEVGAGDGDGDGDGKLLEDAEEEERKLLSGVAQVRCRLFEGKVVQRAQTNTDIANEWKELEKRARVDRTVIVGGMAFILSPPSETIASPAKAPEKRKRAKFESEDWCIHCRDGGELVLCGACPRVFHAKCRGVSKAVVKIKQVSCSQHTCVQCERTTAQAGSMLFRCRTCPQAFCEDCLPDGEIDAIGEVLPEFELLGYGFRSSAYYIRCHDCREYFDSHPSAWSEWEEEFRQTQKKLEAMYSSS